MKSSEYCGTAQKEMITDFDELRINVRNEGSVRVSIPGDVSTLTALCDNAMINDSQMTAISVH